MLHGTGGTKEQMLPILTRYANNNYLACSIDSRYHGERGSPREYSAALIEAFRANAAGEVGAECDPPRPTPLPAHPTAGSRARSAAAQAPFHVRHGVGHDEGD